MTIRHAFILTFDNLSFVIVDTWCPNNFKIFFKSYLSALFECQNLCVFLKMKEQVRRYHLILYIFYFFNFDKA